MKKVNLVIMLMLIVFFTGEGTFAQNSLYSRFEYGWNKKAKQSYREVYNVFETSLPYEFKAGAKIISGQNGYKMLNPFFYYKLRKSVEVGIRYSADSRENEFLASAVRLNWKINQVSVNASYDANLHLRGGRNMPDAWIGIFIPIADKWSYGLESRYFSAKNENFQLRPLKILYKFTKGFSPFLMFQRQWEDRAPIKNSLYVGGIISW